MEEGIINIYVVKCSKKCFEVLYYPIVHRIVEKPIFSLFFKDILMERLRKLNTESPYGKFLMQETLTLNRCMLDIVNDLQVMYIYIS